jgi:hypothetical protein
MTGDPSGEERWVEWEATEHETYLSDELVVVSKSFHPCYENMVSQ